jgi:hypothetical protein
MRRLATLLLLALVLAPLAAAAPKTAVFGLRAVGNPKLGYFVYSLPPGSVRHGGVIVSNSGTATGAVKLFAADATTGRTTGTVYLTDRKGTRVGGWISLSPASLTLAPGQHATVHFTVRVPASAKPGQWVGGLVAETSRQVSGSKSKQKASVQIKIRDLTIVAVQVNVPGPPAIAFKIGGVTTGGQRGFQEVVTHIANTGNVLVKPTGAVTILSKGGTVLQVLPFKMDTFLPGTAVDYPLFLKKALPAGDYRAKVQLRVPAGAGGASRVISAEPAFSVSKQEVQQVFTSAAPQTPPPGAAGASTASKRPWPLIGAGVAAGVLVLLLLLWLLLRRRRRTSAQRPPTVVQRPAPATAAGPAEPPVVPVEPAPIEAPAAAPETPAPDPAVPAPAPASATQPAHCDPYHYWEVAYDRGELGDDGVWRFPHRCRNCGLELLASDVSDATAQADARA